MLLIKLHREGVAFVTGIFAFGQRNRTESHSKRGKNGTNSEDN